MRLLASAAEMPAVAFGGWTVSWTVSSSSSTSSVVQVAAMAAAAVAAAEAEAEAQRANEGTTLVAVAASLGGVREMREEGSESPPLLLLQLL